MPDPLISIVIPCYNQACFLGEAVESVFSQTCLDFEVTVVDDGSTDDSADVAARYPGVQIIQQENRERGAARNAGLCRGHGRYLVFLDADDRLLPTALESGLNYLKPHPEYGFVSGYVKLIANDGVSLGVPEESCINTDHYAALLRYNYIWTTAAVMFRRDALEAVRGFDTRLGITGAEDWDLYLRIARRFPAYCHGEVVAEYRLHKKNTVRNSARMLKHSLTVLRSQRTYLKGNHQYEEAFKFGVKQAQEYYGEPLADEIRDHLRALKWKRAIQNMIMLLRYYPLGFVKHFLPKAILRLPG